jgi:hypothetical protein
MELVTTCQFCHTPHSWKPVEEKNFLYADFWVCSHCNQKNLVTNQLKQDIKRRVGMIQSAH